MLNNEQLFYTCIFPFIAFFGAFAFVLYPMQEMLHPTGEWVGGWAEVVLGLGLRQFVPKLNTPTGGAGGVPPGPATCMPCAFTPLATGCTDAALRSCCQ